MPIAFFVFAFLMFLWRGAGEFSLTYESRHSRDQPLIFGIFASRRAFPSGVFVPFEDGLCMSQVPATVESPAGAAAMSSWPSSNDEDFNSQMDRDVLRQSEGAARQGAFAQRRFSNEEGQAAGFAQRPFAQPQYPSSWRPSSLPPPPHDMGRGHGFGVPQQPLPPASLAPAYELAMLQAQREAMDAEQLRIQRMSQTLGFPRRRSSMSETSSISIPLQQQASERLTKRRRIASPPTVLSNRNGNSFPMPPLEGKGRDAGIESLEMFRKIWEQQVARARLLFPEDAAKEREFVKWRFSSALGGSRFSSSNSSYEEK